MIYFNNDYSEGCHPKILEALARTNLEQTFGYGEDEYCARAAEKIRTLCGREDAAVHLLVIRCWVFPPRTAKSPPDR